MLLFAKKNISLKSLNETGSEIQLLVAHKRPATIVSHIVAMSAVWLLSNGALGPDS